MIKKLFSKNGLMVFVLATLCVFCTCMFFACSSDEETTTEDTTKTYTYTEEDTKYISNGLFSYGTRGKTATDFPISSPTGWSKSTDNSAASSNVDSGVINVGDWDSAFNKLYDDSDFKSFCEKQFKDDEGYKDKTDEEKKAFVKAKFAPSKYSENADSYLYMLNNYNSTYVGTAQRIKSSSTVSVKKGETYAISVYVKTLIFESFDGDGACIRIAPSINGTSQAEFQINNIKNTDWQQYTVYFVADDDYDCSFNVLLGLGYGNGKSDIMSDYVKGTVFFDDVVITANPAEDTSAIAPTTLDFGSKDPVTVDGSLATTFKFSMDFAAAYFTPSVTTEIERQVNNNATEKIIIDNNGANFTLTTLNEDDYETYMLVSFKLQNKLDKLGSTDITVNVKDIYGDITETRKAVATFSDVNKDDEFTNCIILVNNNFKNQTRNFYLEIVIGPETLSDYVNENASGTVKIKDIKYATGYNSSEKYLPLKADDSIYKLYSFYKSNANGTTALYAGYEGDYSEHNHSSSYSLTPANGTVGQIVNHPTALKDYSGITADHVYVKEDSTVYTINDRLSFTGDKGYAGLVNSKYAGNYPVPLKTELDKLHDDEEDIQPIVIYNATLDNYGFIGAQKTVSASDYAKVTVKLKAYGDATAYIYLVDTSSKAKTILSFADFTVNTDAGIKNESVNKTEIKDRKFMLIVNKNTTVGTDGWVTAEFYLATGADAKNFRVEVWNGGRDGANKSQGYVIINSIDVSTSSAFTEPTTWQTAFDDSDSPFYNKIGDFNADGSLVAYARELTDTEKKFNAEYPDKTVSYKANYVWANSDTMVYGVFNTINPVEVDPYASIEEEEEESGCAATSDPSSFWLSFSSILLAAVLVLAIIALFVKKFVAKRKANRSDVKAQYKVKLRTESQKAINKAKAKKAEKEAKADEEPETETHEEPAENTEVSEDNESEENTEDGENAGDETEQTGYVYGEVQDFGDMTLEVPEEKTEDTANNENKDE